MPIVDMANIKVPTWGAPRTRPLTHTALAQCARPNELNELAKCNETHNMNKTVFFLKMRFQRM